MLQATNAEKSGMLAGFIFVPGAETRTQTGGYTGEKAPASAEPSDGVRGEPVPRHRIYIAGSDSPPFPGQINLIPETGFL